MEASVNQYKALCRYKDEPGSGFGWVYVSASNPFEAYQFLKAQYGNLLISDSAMPA
jgi:hypothetical protein